MYRPRRLTDDDRARSQYLGDGLYTRDDGHAFAIFASNGETVSDEVFVEAVDIPNLLVRLQKKIGRTGRIETDA